MLLNFIYKQTSITYTFNRSRRTSTRPSTAVPQRPRSDARPRPRTAQRVPPNRRSMLINERPMSRGRDRINQDLNMTASTIQIFDENSSMINIMTVNQS